MITEVFTGKTNQEKEGIPKKKYLRYPKFPFKCTYGERERERESETH